MFTLIAYPARGQTFQNKMQVDNGTVLDKGIAKLMIINALFLAMWNGSIVTLAFSF